MSIKTFDVEIEGKSPLLLHHDNIEWADVMDAWKNDPGNRRVSKAGDDRSPPHRWLGCLYHDGATLTVPAGNLMRAIMEGGAMVPVPGGRSGKTFKAQTQSGMMSVGTHWALSVDGHDVSWSDVQKLAELPRFSDHVAGARRLGFDLLVKRAKVGQAKHIRVRPQFSRWGLSGQLAVWDEQITIEVLEQILAYAGQYKGLGDWRPGGKTPGPYGTFAAVIGEA